MIFISAGHNNQKGTKNYDPGAVGKIASTQILEADLTQDFICPSRYSENTSKL